MATVCGGSLALAMAGLLEGRTPKRTRSASRFSSHRGRAVHARVVDDGDLISASGVTSGLDLGLYLLERHFGSRIARAVEQLFVHERRGTPWRSPAAGQTR